MMNIILNYIKKKREYFKSALTIKNIMLFSLIIILVLSGVALFILIAYKLLEFIIAKMDLLVLSVSIIYGAIYFTRTYFNKRKENRYDVATNIAKQEEEQERLHAEETYKLIRQCLYLVSNELINTTHLHSIASPSELDTPNHFVFQNGYYIYQYLIAKDFSKMDSESIKIVFERRIEQRLNAQEFSGLTQKIYVHTSGRSYPIMCVDKVTDMGSYIQVDIAWSGKTYCEYVEGCQQFRRKMIVNSSCIQDKDF